MSIENKIALLFGGNCRVSKLASEAYDVIMVGKDRFIFCNGNKINITGYDIKYIRGNVAIFYNSRSDIVFNCKNGKWFKAFYNTVRVHYKYITAYAYIEGKPALVLINIKDFSIVRYIFYRDTVNKVKFYDIRKEDKIVKLDIDDTTEVRFYIDIDKIEVDFKKTGKVKVYKSGGVHTWIEAKDNIKPSYTIDMIKLLYGNKATIFSDNIALISGKRNNKLLVDGNKIIDIGEMVVDSIEDSIAVCTGKGGAKLLNIKTMQEVNTYEDCFNESLGNWMVLTKENTINVYDRELKLLCTKECDKNYEYLKVVNDCNNIITAVVEYFDQKACTGVKKYVTYNWKKNTLEIGD